jgi:hypothetical protein
MIAPWGESEDIPYLAVQTTQFTVGNGDSGVNAVETGESMRRNTLTVRRLPIVCTPFEKSRQRLRNIEKGIGWRVTPPA